MLLPDLCLSRRQDEVAVIGQAIEAKVAGAGFSTDRWRLGVRADTVRGWLRRFDERAELIRAHFTRCAVALDPELGPIMPAGSGVADALEAIAVAAGRGCCGSGRVTVADRWRAVGRGAVGNTNRPVADGV